MRIFLCLFLITAIGCSQSVKFTDKARTGPIVILGDSLAEGYLVEKNEGFISVLSERLDIEIVNLGRKGATTAESLRRVDEEVLSLSPALVLLQLGGNDALQKVDPEVTKTNLQTMISQMHKQEIPILLLGVRGGLMSDKLAYAYEDLVSDNGLAYVSNILEGILTSPGLRVDNVHPNAKGHILIADRIEPVLKDLVQKLGLKSK